jgi:hypothetical protein
MARLKSRPFKTVVFPQPVKSQRKQVACDAETKAKALGYQSRPFKATTFFAACEAAPFNNRTTLIPNLL